MSTSTARIYDISTRAEIVEPIANSTPASTASFAKRLRVQPRIVDKVVDESVSSALIDIEDLYPNMGATRPQLNTALRLLAESLSELQTAGEAASRGADISGDDAVQRFQAKLPELFNCRVLGDGFGAIINATIHAMNNRYGEPLSVAQVETLAGALRELRSRPFMDFDKAVTQIMAIEETGLQVEPAEFEVLADWLDE
jgi:hypothetical protein